MMDENVKTDKDQMTERQVFPGGAFRKPDSFVQNFLRMPPGANNLDIRPARSASTSHGYLILTAPEYWDLLDEMYESDEVLRMCLDLMVAYMLMRPQGVRVEEAESDSRAEEIQTFFEKEVVLNPRVNFRYLCWSLAIGILKHGRSTGEIVWGQTPDGKMVPKQFYHCHPGQFAFNREGGMYLQTDMAKLEPLPPYKFVSAVNSSLYDNPWGDSALFPFRYKWQYKKRVLISKLQYLERFGTPIVHGKIPKETTEKELAMAELISAIEQLDSGMALVTALGEEVVVHQRSTSALGGSDGVHDAIIDRIDSYFVRALLGAELNTTAGDRGARSLGEVHERTVLNKILPLARIVEKVLNLEVFDPIRILNFGENSPVVRYWFDTEESTDASDARETLDCATRNGVPVTVRQAQEMLGIEPANPSDELLDRPSITIPPRDTETGRDESRGSIIPLPEDEEEAAASETKFAAYSYGSTQLDFTEGKAAVQRWLDAEIDPDDLYEDEQEPGKYGKVYDSHVTVLSGLRPEVTREDVENAVAGEWPQWVWVGHYKVFSAENYDVLTMEIELDDGLKSLRKALETLPYEATHPTYQPHLTLAYLKKGTVDKYLELETPLAGWLEYVDHLTFSNADDVREMIALTGPLVAMKGDPIDRAWGSWNQMLELNPRIRESALEMWSRNDSGGTKFRDMRGEINREAETQGHEWSEKIAKAAIGDTRSQLVDVMKDTAERLRKYDVTHQMNPTLVSDVDTSKLDLEVTARRIVLSTFMIRRWIAFHELEGVKDAQPKFRNVYSQLFDRYDEGEVDIETILATLPDDFKDAAEWMASRGVMTVERVRELAQIMAEEFGGDARQWERNLRDEYLALARSGGTGATKRIQGMIEDAVRGGETLLDFLTRIESLVNIGDVPPGLESYWETVFRTEVGNAYKKAQMQNEMDPDFEPWHWGWEGYNPQDDRSEPSHAAVNKKRFKKGSAASGILGLPPFRYNCRCAMFALTTPLPSQPSFEESKDALSIAAQVTKF